MSTYVMSEINGIQRVIPEPAPDPGEPPGEQGEGSGG
jgi:hypothetical protein